MVCSFFAWIWLNAWLKTSTKGESLILASRERYNTTQLPNLAPSPASCVLTRIGSIAQSYHIIGPIDCMGIGNQAIGSYAARIRVKRGAEGWMDILMPSLSVRRQTPDHIE